jgi:hypothetical protein
MKDSGCSQQLLLFSATSPRLLLALEGYIHLADGRHVDPFTFQQFPDRQYLQARVVTSGRVVKSTGSRLAAHLRSRVGHRVGLILGWPQERSLFNYLALLRPSFVLISA